MTRDEYRDKLALEYRGNAYETKSFQDGFDTAAEHIELLEKIMVIIESGTKSISCMTLAEGALEKLPWRKP